MKWLWRLIFLLVAFVALLMLYTGWIAAPVSVKLLVREILNIKRMLLIKVSS